MQTEQKSLSLWSLLRFLKPYKGLVILTLLSLTAGRIFSSLDPLWLKKIIDGIGQGSPFSALVPVLMIYFGLQLARIFFDFFRDWFFATVTQGASRNLSQTVYDHLLKLSVGYHHNQRLGVIARKVVRGGRAVSLMVDILTTQVLPSFIELIIVTILLLQLYAPVYAIITFCTVVTYTVFTIWATEKRQKYRIASNKAEDEVSGQEIDTLTNIETIKYFNSEPQLLRRYIPLVQNWFKLSVASNRLFSAVAAGQSFVLLIGFGSILIIAINQALSGILTIGDLVLLTTYVVRLTAPIDALGFIYRQLKDNLTDLQGIAKILHEEISVKEPAQPVALPKPEGRVEFRNVGFQYTSSRPVLQNISLTAKPGERIAFVGPSGVGKSTVVKLLFRFFDPTEGEILIDGVPLHSLDKETRRNVFGIVPQEPTLFNTTIGENIRFGKPDASNEEVEHAAKLANIHQFISSLHDGYETVVGERGVKLSGGEKQRVAIARAIIRDPKILVFDEATSSLDSHSERIIQESLEAVSKGRTTLAVAHRLSTIADADQIYVLQKGGIAEQGTHQELLKKNGLYAKLWRTQSRGSESSGSIDQNAE